MTKFATKDVNMDGVLDEKDVVGAGKEFLNNWTYDEGFDKSAQGKMYQQDWLRKNPEASRKEIHDQYVKEKKYGADFDALSDAERHAQYDKYGQTDQIKLKGVNWSYADGGLQFKKGAQFTGESARNEKSNLQTEKEWESKAKQDWINQQLQAEGITGRGASKLGKYAFRGEQSPDSLIYVDNPNLQYGKGGKIGSSDWSKEFLKKKVEEVKQTDAATDTGQQTATDTGQQTTTGGDTTGSSGATGTKEPVVVNEGRAIQPGQIDYEYMSTEKEDELKQQKKKASAQDQKLSSKGMNTSATTDINKKHPDFTKGSGWERDKSGVTGGSKGKAKPKDAYTPKKPFDDSYQYRKTDKERDRADRDRRIGLLTGRMDTEYGGSSSSNVDRDSARIKLLTGRGDSSSRDYQYRETNKEKDRGQIRDYRGDYRDRGSDFTKNYLKKIAGAVGGIADDWR